MQVKIVLLFVALFIAYLSEGQVISGKIISGNENIIGAHIKVKNSDIITVTDVNGKFRLKLQKYGTYILKITAIGYNNLEKKITINSDSIYIEIEIDENISALNEVVISGSLEEVSKLASPVNIEIITPKLFQKNPTSNLFESLNMVNGIKPQINCSVCNTGDIHINGLEGAYTMVLIDGMPIVSSLSTVYGLSGIPNSMIDRVEVIKGPNSTLYGSEAMAGVINVITKQPEKMSPFQTDMMATSQGDYNLDIATKAKWKNVNTLFSANYYHFDKASDINNDNFTDVTLQKRFSVFNKWSVNRPNNRLANIGIRLYTEDRWGGELQYEKKYRGTDSVYAESIITNRLEIIGQYQLPIKEKVTFSFSGNLHKQDSYYGIIPFMANQNVLFGQLIWNKKLNIRNQLLSGISIRSTHYKDNTAVTNGNITNVLLPGIFIQNETNITEKHTLMLGLRTDYHNLHGMIFSPRLNHKWQLNSVNSIRMGVGNGFRVVNIFTEDHASLTGSRKVLIDKDISPEKSINATINFNRFININSGFLNLDFSTFYTYFTNKIVPDYDTDLELIIYKNLNGFAVSKGFSGSADISLNNGLKIISGFTVLDVFSQTDEIKSKQKFVSPFSGNFSISYQIKKLTLDYTGNIYSPMQLPVVENDFRPSHSDWYSIQNIQFTIPITKKMGNMIELYGGVKNILNFIPQHPILRPFDPFDKQTHVNNPNNYSFDTTYMYAPMQGRRFFVGIRMTLK